MSDKIKKWDEMQTKIDGMTDALGVGIEPGIKEIVICLNLLGFPTDSSCEGHIFSEDRGLPYPWVGISAQNDADVKEKMLEYYKIHDSVRVPLNTEFKEKYGNMDDWPDVVYHIWAKEFNQRLEKHPQFKIYKDIENFIKEKTEKYVEQLKLLIVTHNTSQKNQQVQYGFPETLSRLEPVKVPSDFEETLRLSNLDDRTEARKNIDPQKYDMLLKLSQEEMKSLASFFKEFFFAN